MSPIRNKFLNEMKNKLVAGLGVGVASIVSFATMLPSAFAQFTFTLPASTTADLTAQVGGIISSTWVLVAIAIGIPLAFYILRKVIGLIPKR